MGNKLFKNEEDLLCELIRSTNNDNPFPKTNGKKSIMVSKYEDLPRFCIKTLKREKLTEKEVNDDQKLHILCRLLSYDQKRSICSTSYKPNERKKSLPTLAETKMIGSLPTIFYHPLNQSSGNINNNNTDSPNKRLLLSRSDTVYRNEFKPQNKNHKRDNIKVDWNLPFGVLLIIFSFCDYSDHFTLINVCKYWKKIYFKHMAKKYEKAVVMFKENKKFSKYYRIQELIMVDQKNSSSYIAKDLKLNVNCRVDIVRLDKKRKKIDKYLKKVHFLSILDHKFFPSIKDVFVNISGLNVITQISDGVNLRELNKVSQLDEPKIAYIMKKILDGINYAHSHGIILRSLSLSNIQIESSGSIKICDLNGAIYSKYHTIHTSIEGSILYASPEMINGSYSFKNDIFSLGILGLYLLRQKTSNKKHYLRNLFKNCTEISYNLPPHRTLDAISFLDQTLQKNPDKRISIDELYLHPFLSLSECENKETMKVLVSQLIFPITLNRTFQIYL